MSDLETRICKEACLSAYGTKKASQLPGRVMDEGRVEFSLPWWVPSQGGRETSVCSVGRSQLFQSMSIHHILPVTKETSSHQTCKSPILSSCWLLSLWRINSHHLSCCLLIQHYPRYHSLNFRYIEKNLDVIKSKIKTPRCLKENDLNRVVLMETE